MPQIGTVKLKAVGGIIAIPICDLDDAEEFNHPPFCIKVKTPSGIGHTPLVQTTDGHAHPVRLKTQDGILAVCDICQDSVEVTLSGLGGDFAAWNDSHILGFRNPDINPANAWAKGSEPWPKLVLYWAQSASIWRVTLMLDGQCWKYWHKAGACTMCGTYYEANCADLDCSDTDSCEKSVGATCVVTAGEQP